MAAKKTTKKKKSKKVTNETQFSNGGTHSSVIWNKKTDEEKEAILLERRTKRTLNKRLETVFDAQANEWLSGANNATAVMLMKAIKEADVPAYNAFMDRLFGKPKNNKEEEVETSNDDMIQAILALVGKLPD